MDMYRGSIATHSYANEQRSQLLATAYLEHPHHNDADRIQLGGGRDEQVEAGGEEDGRPKEPVGGEPRSQETTRQLGHDVTPEEGGVHDQVPGEADSQTEEVDTEGQGSPPRAGG